MTEHSRHQEILAPYSLPKLIDTAYPFVAIQDLGEIGHAFDIAIDAQILDTYQRRLQDIQQIGAPQDSTFYEINATHLNQHLELIAVREAGRTDRSIGVVHMDRYIGKDHLGPNFARLDVSRNKNNELVSRHGVDATPEEQIEALAAWALEYRFDELLLIDDVLAFGDTFPTILRQLKDQLANEVSFRFLTGIAATSGVWRGLEKVYEETGVETEYLTMVVASPAVEGKSKGMSIPVSRDLTIFGGKIDKTDEGHALSFPYFLPFSKPLGSIIDTDQQLERSLDLIEFNKGFIVALEEKLGRTLTIGDLQSRGFGIPHTSLKSIGALMTLPNPEDSVLGYLEYAEAILETHVDAIMDECEGKAA